MYLTSITGNKVKEGNIKKTWQIGKGMLLSKYVWDGYREAGIRDANRGKGDSVIVWCVKADYIQLA